MWHVGNLIALRKSMEAAAAIACQPRIESGRRFCSIDPVSCIVSRPTQLC